MHTYVCSCYTDFCIEMANLLYAMDDIKRIFSPLTYFKIKI